MKKIDLPVYVQNTLKDGADLIFLQAYQQALQKGVSSASAYTAAYLALVDAGYQKQPNGCWCKSQQKQLLVKMDKVLSKNEDERLVFGFFSVVEQSGVPVIDSQGDVITSKELEKATYKYVKFSRMGDDRHDERCKATLIESMVLTKEKQQVLGIDLGLVGWWGGFEVHDDVLWQKFKSGEYESFSIGGRGEYATLEL